MSFETYSLPNGGCFAIGTDEEIYEHELQEGFLEPDEVFIDVMYFRSGDDEFPTNEQRVYFKEGQWNADVFHQVVNEKMMPEFFADGMYEPLVSTLYHYQQI